MLVIRLMVKKKLVYKKYRDSLYFFYIKYVDNIQKKIII
jgi:hypothetical protein